MAENKYRVIKRLEAGGMAEVYIGEAVSVQGFKKTVAIKRVLPHLAQNENFIKMFLDEARLSAKLNHANIVTVFDISAHEDTYFLIMEFVEGANLKKVMENLRGRDRRIRLAEAAYICMEACRGLSYAHELTDDSGTPLGIVHRDVSPPNIMVTKRGEVKVADFGLAKAGTQLEKTDPGVVKGKFSYLSPEAANGLEVDSRTDVFSLGIVLWEMIAGRRLFLGENDYGTVKLIQAANIPRLTPLNRDVDEAFEEVLLKALARDPASRYQSAREFGDALAGYLFNRQLKVTSYDLANLVTAATSVEGGTGRTDKSIMDELIQDELDGAVGIGSSATPAPGSVAGPLPQQTSEGLEDPSSWFNDDDLFGSGPSLKPEPDGPPDRADASEGSWREGGLVANAEGSGAHPTLPEATPDESGALDVPTQDHDRQEPAPASAPEPPPAESSAKPKGSGIVLKVAIVAVVIVVLAAAAWIGTQL